MKNLVHMKVCTPKLLKVWQIDLLFFIYFINVKATDINNLIASN
jgi:hypothetical protein